MKTLSFNGKTIEIFKEDDQVWITSKELARALDYQNHKSVANLYNSNHDEFTPSMTLVTETMTNGINNSLRSISTRIFSLRGCHLIAMFARTEVAKQFRKWVLDLIENHTKPDYSVEKTISVAQAEIISKAVESLCRDKGISWQEVYPVLHTEFNVRSYTEILEKDFDRVLAMLNYKRPYSSYNPEDALRVNTVALAVHMIWVSVWFEEYETALRKFNNRLGATLTDRFRDGRGVAKSLLREYGMTDKIPQIPKDFPWGGEYWEQDNSLKQLNLL